MNHKEYFDYFITLTSLGGTHQESYEALEAVHIERYGRRKYANYKTFKVAKSVYMSQEKSRRLAMLTSKKIISPPTV